MRIVSGEALYMDGRSREVREMWVQRAIEHYAPLDVFGAKFTKDLSVPSDPKAIEYWNRVNQAREQAGMTRATLAARTGTTSDRLIYLRRWGRWPKAELRAAIVDVLGVE